MHVHNNMVNEFYNSKSLNYIRGFHPEYESNLIYDVYAVMPYLYIGMMINNHKNWNSYIFYLTWNWLPLNVFKCSWFAVLHEHEGTTKPTKPSSGDGRQVVNVIFFYQLALGSWQAKAEEKTRPDKTDYKK